MAQQTLVQIRKIRLEKVAKLRELGINPYPAESKKEFSNAEVVKNFESFEGRVVTLAGRLMSWREHGALIFGHLQDESGRIQVFIQKDKLSETSKEDQTVGFSDMHLLDVGDFLEVTGEIIKSTRGEVSIVPTAIKILTKSLRPLPDKWEGLSDPELIFRKRYLDLVMNPDRREVFKRKAKFWTANREFMKKHGFIEVETPVMEHYTGGADAEPFVTHHNALDEDFYLRISTELYQKRLVGGGFEKIYTIGPNFRNEGIDDEHLQEYYQIEWYWAYVNYRHNMELVRDMMRFIAKEVYGKTQFEAHGHAFDLSDEWVEVDYVEIIKSTHGIDIFTASDEEMLEVIKKHGVKLPGEINRFRLIDNLWKIIRKSIAGPAFLINEPKFMSPLAKSKQDNEVITERFHVIIAGSELGNGYSELNDPVDQYERFLEQQAARDQGDDEAQMLDIDYVEMLEYGMPPTSGYGHSERLFWFLENLSAREATLFPQMKKKIDPSVKEIYSDFKIDGERDSK
jgi:lysyl-tRNA synthetase, class II